VTAATYLPDGPRCDCCGDRHPLTLLTDFAGSSTRYCDRCWLGISDLLGHDTSPATSPEHTPR
jgi:hypothetical protein